jgi:hypothetical protein
VLKPCEIRIGFEDSIPSEYESEELALEIAEWIINSVRLESGSISISAIWSGLDVVGSDLEVPAPDAKEAAKRMSLLPLTQSKPSPK